MWRMWLVALRVERLTERGVIEPHERPAHERVEVAIQDLAVQGRHRAPEEVINFVRHGRLLRQGRRFGRG